MKVLAEGLFNYIGSLFFLGGPILSITFKSLFILLFLIANLSAKEHILLLGTSRSIESGVNSYDLESLSSELQDLMDQDSRPVQVSFEDIYASQDITFGLGGGGAEYTWEFRRHSILQYWTWPDERDKRLNFLRGIEEKQWDKVLILADPYIMTQFPGYFALGLQQIAKEISLGGAEIYVLQPWVDTHLGIDQATFNHHLKEVINHLETPVHLILGAVARNEQVSPEDILIDQSSGSELIASTFYNHIYDKPRPLSELGDLSVKESLDSPFDFCDLNTSQFTYNHTGSSSERGILRGLNSSFNQSHAYSLSQGTDLTPYSFNFGRANTYFEANKRYQLDSNQFSYSFGFPMQDHSNNGDTSMLYGLDWRQSSTENGTDLGVARKMLRDNELPLARAVPIRTLYALIKAAMPDQSAYSDNWHMNKDLDRASGAFIYTLLTGDFPQYDEPADSNSAEWISWKATSIGHQTAWTLASFKSVHPDDYITSSLSQRAHQALFQSEHLNDQLIFSSSETLEQVSIFNLNGSRVFSQTLGVSHGILDLKSLPQGVYWVKFQSQHNTQWSHKISYR